MPHLSAARRSRAQRRCAAAAAHHWRRPGLTLLEVLVASVLLGTGVAGLISAASLALRNQNRIAHRTAALLFAHEQLQQVDVIGPYAWRLGFPLRGSETRGDVAYEWTLDIEHLGVGELHRVTAEVRWRSPSDEGRVELETWLCDYRNTGAAVEAPEAAPAPEGR